MCNFENVGVVVVGGGGEANCCVYSGTSLLRTPLGPHEVS